MHDRISALRNLNTVHGASDERVTEIAALEAEIAHTHERRAKVLPVVFHAYYRTAKGRKGYREFKTRPALNRFIATTNHAITAFN